MKNEDIFSTDVEKVLPALKFELTRLSTIWLPRGRSGDGEAGRLLEEELGVPENNREDADIPIGDLKTTTTKTKLTLFTKEGPLLLPKPEIYDRFGFTGRSHGITIQSTVTSTPNGRDFFYHCEADGVYLACRDTDIQFWEWDKLAKKFAAKFPSVISVYYVTKKIDGVQCFQFRNAYYYPSVDSTCDAFLAEFKAGNITIEVRRYWDPIKEVEPHNHGTAFRVDKQVFDRIFQTRQTII